MSSDEPQSVNQKLQARLRQHQHDPFFRSTFGEPEMFRKLLVWLLPIVVELLDLDRVEQEKDALLDEQLKAYYTDLLYRMPIRGTDESIIVFVLVEHKTSSERWTMFQILRYIVLIWQREYHIAKEQGRLAEFMLPPILPIIIYHGERKFNAAIRLGKLIRPMIGFEKYQLDFESMLLDLTQTEENALPKDDLELYCVLAVMQAVFRKDIDERMLRIYKKMQPKFREDKRYFDRWLKLYYYMRSSSKYLYIKDLDEVKSQMSDTDTEVIIPPWIQESLFDARQKGREEGVALGIEKGIEKGIETLLRILSKNFGVVPLSISEKLRAIHDFDELDQLTDLALDCRSLDEFEKALVKYTQAD
jgi:predicted transposase/invertase (TIGR01784 family)